MMAMTTTKGAQDAYRVLEDDPLGIALADPFGLDAVGTCWLLLATLDPTLSTSYNAWSMRYLLARAL